VGPLGQATKMVAMSGTRILRQKCFMFPLENIVYPIVGRAKAAITTLSRLKLLMDS
jgi:hypothetical protein